MRWTNLGWAAAIVASMAPAANAETTEPGTLAACYPGADDTATQIRNLYLRQTGRATKYTEIWQETNDIPGLQTSSAMACGGPADVLSLEACAGLVGCRLG